MLLEYLATNWRLGMIWNDTCIEPTGKKRYHYCSPTQKLPINRLLV